MEISKEQKVQRLLTKYPKVGVVLKEISDNKDKLEKLKNLVSTLQPKMVLIGRDTPDLYLWYQLAYILKYGYIHTSEFTTIDLLEGYLGEIEDITRLSQVSDDLVIIKDSRSFVPNKQKPNFVSQVFEQNDKVLYYYVGTTGQFNDDMTIFKQYCEDNHIDMVTLVKKTEVYDDFNC